MMDKVKVKQVILCTKGRRGSGKNAVSPVRIITEVFDFDGNLIADNDPCGDYSPEIILGFLKWKYKAISDDVHTENVRSYFLEDEVE
jgi:hypothetical protein